ncbi:hypothetical protein BS47DRAFT_431589 [Hydnum rufescens UP504]|uniref:Uncharacterized protein n=1 Tax=Hydnum rufescens UP504 TaxID=1448309 RepID=A0A9P6AJ08_9AGAM|nr:hypothetical protein BS47DRAFT_431589 [Hydnum rufescens UP504]
MIELGSDLSRHCELSGRYPTLHLSHARLRMASFVLSLILFHVLAPEYFMNSY